MCKISFSLPNLVAFSCYTVNIHLEKWLMRCDIKRFNEIYTTNTYLYFASNIWVPSFARCRLTNDSQKPKYFFSFCKINATKFGTRNEIPHKIIYHHMTSYGYIIIIKVASCIIWFHLDCFMQLKKSYCVATNVSSRKVLLLLVISLTG